MTQEERKDPFDGEYVGNIWGWRFSFISLGFIVLLVGFMVYRHYSLGVGPGFDDPLAPTEVETEIEKDTIK